MNEPTTVRKNKSGTVISNKMDKTVVVNVNRTLKHPRYGKVLVRGKKFYAHHEGEPLQIGDKVIIEETRPLSKMKKWRVVSKVEA